MSNDKTPAQLEAEGGTTTIEWQGHTIVLPASPEDWDIDVTRAFARGDAMGALEGIIGADAFGTLERAHRKAHGGRFLMRDLEPLVNSIAELYGLDDLGN